jgi:membrane-bound acyltransferase YfiQ involved in biofilm formation
MEINLLGYLAHLVLDLAFCCLLNLARLQRNRKERFLTGKKPKQDDLVDMLNYLVQRATILQLQ